MKATIASLYFAPLHADRSQYSGVYDIPAVPKGEKPFLLDIPDMVERWHGPYSEGHKLISKIWGGEKIAVDLIQHWTTMGLGMTPTCHPGAWIVRDKIHVTDAEGKLKFDFDDDGKLTKPVWRDATPEEFKAMWAEDLKAAQEADANFAEYLMDVATAKTTNHPEQIPYVDSRAKLAAAQYGRDFPWLHRTVNASDVKCPYCKKTVDPDAAVCPFCQNPVNVERYAELQAKAKLAVEAAMKTQPVKPPVKSAA